MATINTEVTYAGLKLKNPFVISSSGLTENADKIEILEKCGASAVVLKSLFEEQIMMNVEKDLQSGNYDYPEAHDFLQNFLTADHIEKYLNVIRESKKRCSIPIIASINCYSKRSWIQFAKSIEEAGADALEVNIMLVNTDKESKPDVSETLHIEILAELKKVIKIPVIMKLSNHFTNLVYLVNQLQHNDADGVVLFNRSFSPDIDIKNLRFTTGPVLSDPTIFHETLRWTGIVSGMVPKIDIAASGGIHDAENAIKALLAGAKVTQLCSVIYKEGPDQIAFMNTKLISWMQEHGFERIDQFRGKMNFANFEDENYYERTQFMKYFSNRDNYPPMQ
ncbi:MAG: dihydroorotate dehydrogenase-like protein [Bacteroidales bacterium]